MLNFFIKYVLVCVCSVCGCQGVAMATCHSRGEGGVIFGPQVIGVQVEHADHKGHEDHDEDDHELEDVLHGSSQRDLQRPEALIGREDVGDTREAQDHGDGIQTLGDDLRIWRPPPVPRCDRDTQRALLEILCWYRGTFCNWELIPI